LVFNFRALARIGDCAVSVIQASAALAR